MKRYLPLLRWAVGLEALFLVLCYLFPGNGHSPLWYTQIPALMVVVKVAPEIGSCIPCAPLAWALGALIEASLLFVLMVGAGAGMRLLRASPVDRAV